MYVRWFIFLYDLVNLSPPMHFLSMWLCNTIAIIIIIITPYDFFTPAYADGFHLFLSDSKSPQVSQTLLNILVDLNSAVVWIVFACPPVCNASSSFTKSLVIVQMHQLELVSSSSSWAIAFLVLWKNLKICFFFFFFFFWLLLYGRPKQQSLLFGRFLFLFGNHH